MRPGYEAALALVPSPHERNNMRPGYEAALALVPSPHERNNMRPGYEAALVCVSYIRFGMKQFPIAGHPSTTDEAWLIIS